MALGKKKQDEPAVALEPAEPAEADDSGADALAPADPLDPQPEAGSTEGQPQTDAAAGNSDALLAMFHSDDTKVSDYATFLALAPEVELEDMLEELRTTAAALGCKASDGDYAA